MRPSILLVIAIIAVVVFAVIMSKGVARIGASLIGTVAAVVAVLWVWRETNGDPAILAAKIEEWGIKVAETVGTLLGQVIEWVLTFLTSM